MWQDPNNRSNRAWQRAILEIRGAAQGGQRQAAAVCALPPTVHADHRGRPPPRQLLPHGLATQVGPNKTTG